MRIIIILSVFLVPLGSASQLASVHKPVFLIGIKADAQAAGIANQNNYGQNEMDYGVNIGIGGGVVVTYLLNPRNAFILETSYQSSGQKYDDQFKNRHFMKDVRYSLISIPLAFRHQLTDAPGGYSGVGTESKPLWYILGGVQVDRILSPEIRWQLDGNETDFLSFVLEGGNPNQAEIENLGEPASDEEFYIQWDVMGIAAIGFQLSLTPTMHFTTELRGGIGITDMNAESWRLKNNDGIYAASRNAFFGLHAGIHMQLTHL
ncbi:MAG TPA: hypothetical protein VI603_06290 [Saprospiraceae bacterium]|nr:hypothetical protein [Saprospiraceae bacterium]